MSDVHVFPCSSAQALALLYVQKKEYENPTPEQLAEDYKIAYSSINEYFKDNKKPSDWF
ncbi:MAG: hypothetical protein Q4G60_15200 [bacterium]|nr:hypothetical protein [bacterium]